MNTIDTRDLIEERNKLKLQILGSFLENFEHYVYRTEAFEDILFEEEEIESWKEEWEDELKQIEQINQLENDVCNGEFDYETTLIEEDDFEDFVKQDLEDCGYISKDFPVWIEVDWEATADNVRQDYSEVEFRGITYLYR
jgi:hypothetical protein